MAWPTGQAGCQMQRPAAHGAPAGRAARRSPSPQRPTHPVKAAKADRRAPGCGSARMPGDIGLSRLSQKNRCRPVFARLPQPVFIHSPLGGQDRSTARPSNRTSPASIWSRCGWARNLRPRAMATPGQQADNEDDLPGKRVEEPAAGVRDSWAGSIPAARSANQSATESASSSQGRRRPSQSIAGVTARRTAYIGRMFT